MTSNTHMFSNAHLNQVQNIEQIQLQEGYVTFLDDQSLILAKGEDAATFLHNQLSNDVENLPNNRMNYAAYCTAKGRMQASLQYWKDAQGILMQCSASLQPAFQKRISMFVMRSKLTLEDISSVYVLIGIGGKNAGQFLQQYFSELPQAHYDKVESENGTVIRVSDAFAQPRYQWMIKQALFCTLQNTNAIELMLVESKAWRLADILSGIPQVVEKTKEQFVPQMINFELIGGVNFKKGCYPGQEIVARSQYLGKLKRRMAIATVDTNQVEIGMEVFSDNDTSQACGMIVNCEPHFNQGSVCLVELKLADQEVGKVRLGSNEGTLLNFLPLPYAYLDITE